MQQIVSFKETLCFILYTIYLNMNSLEFKKIRKKLNLTQSELADLLKITRKTVGIYETKGEIPVIVSLALQQLEYKNATKSYIPLENQKTSELEKNQMVSEEDITGIKPLNKGIENFDQFLESAQFENAVLKIIDRKEVKIMKDELLDYIADSIKEAREIEKGRNILKKKD